MRMLEAKGPDFFEWKELKTMARSIRVFYNNVQGVVRRNFNWPAINIRSAVIIAAAEWQSDPLGPSLDGTHRPFLGAAPI